MSYFCSFCFLSAQAQNNKVNAEKFNKQAETAYQRVQSNTDRDSLAIYRACGRWNIVFVKMR